MSGEIKGKVVVQGLKASKTIRCFLKKRIEKWFREHPGQNSDELQYFLKIDNLEARNRYQCFLFIRDKEGPKRAFDMGKNLQDAVENAFRHLRPLK
ncbi:MAG: hypothetical protein ACOYL6_12130 [Bacteriovoracaceae bacterium]